MVVKLAITALCLLAAVAAGKDAVADVDSRLQELLKLRKGAKSGFLSFSDEDFAKYGLKPGRGYTLIVFLTANQMMSNPQLKLSTVKKELALAVKAQHKGPDGDKPVFLVEMVYEKSPEVFHLVQAQHVPFVFRLGPEMKTKKSMSSLPLAAKDKLVIQESTQRYPWTAEDIIEVFFTPFGVATAPVHRPNLLKEPWFPYAVLASLPLLAFVAWKLWWTPLVQKPYLWCLGSLAVYTFSSSGGMFNIIRGMPFFIYDKEGKIQLFLTSRGAQLGAEGFIMGGGYLALSCCVAVLALGLPYVRNGWLRFATSWTALVVGSYSAFKVMEFWMAKSGYQYTSFLF